MGVGMEQLLLSFFADATSVVFHAENSHVILCVYFDGDFGIFIAELDSIADEITDDSLDHVDVASYQ